MIVTDENKDINILTRYLHDFFSSNAMLYPDLDLARHIKYSLMQLDEVNIEGRPLRVVV